MITIVTANLTRNSTLKAQILTIHFCLFFQQRRDRAKKQGGGERQRHRDKNRPWLSRWLLLRVVSSRNERRLLSFFSAVLAVRFGQFNPSFVGAAKMVKKKKKEQQRKGISGLKRGKSVIGVVTLTWPWRLQAVVVFLYLPPPTSMLHRRCVTRPNLLL